MASTLDLPSLTADQARAILKKHLSLDSDVTSVTSSPDAALSTLSPSTNFVVHLADGTSHIVRATIPASSTSVYTPNTLAIEHSLRQLLSKRPDIPQPTVHGYDDSLEITPFPYLLLSRPRGITLSQARASGKLSERQSLLLDLRIGSLYKSLHDNVQNDWFGLPTQEKDELYSWQEAFTWLLEGLLTQVRESGEDLPFEDVRRYLSRAIGFFLFDDCEVPSLISFLGDEDTILVDFDPESPSTHEEVPITSLVPVSHALWGDPLLENIFLNPTDAFLEGYGTNLMIFPRQKTKRLWYTLFMALAVLAQISGKNEEDEKVRQRAEWARKIAKESIEKLKDAPYY
ncbi:hypothetical protein K474DRAFT_1713747 [Panus rudis PR-1116 ss-1]|nr:hypothetical protein K474DRAFT_1713747 [Panus rudis PR-1116 ss-1]